MEMSKHATIVNLKMHVAVWAARKRDEIVASAGLHVDGCPLCGERDVCPVCNLCDYHHDTVLDMLGEREVTGIAITRFMTAFCGANLEGMIAAMRSIAHPEETIASYREPCVATEVADNINIDTELWSQFFQELGDNDDDDHINDDEG